MRMSIGLSTPNQYQPVNQSLNDGHLCLLELLLGITSSSVGKVDGVADLNVVGKGDVLHFNTTADLAWSNTAA